LRNGVSHKLNRIPDHARAEHVPNPRVYPVVHRDLDAAFLAEARIGRSRLLEPAQERLRAPVGNEPVGLAVLEQELLALEAVEQDLLLSGLVLRGGSGGGDFCGAEEERLGVHLAAGLDQRRREVLAAQEGGALVFGRPGAELGEAGAV